MWFMVFSLQGVPPTLRPWVWMEASGAAAKKAAVKSSNYFSNMALAGERSPFLKDIDQVRTAVLRHSQGPAAAYWHTEVHISCLRVRLQTVLASSTADVRGYMQFIVMLQGVLDSTGPLPQARDCCVACASSCRTPRTRSPTTHGCTSLMARPL
eukprot:GHRQ01019410.1.p1 GENE.GHRQ01019410.1~~GHRQ01019410.1.p1  ORF type:complete len:154 (-),score=33.76 GHRQ01019410.1:142-603(-)